MLLQEDISETSQTYKTHCFYFSLISCTICIGCLEWLKQTKRVSFCVRSRRWDNKTAISKKPWITNYIYIINNIYMNALVSNSCFCFGGDEMSTTATKPVCMIWVGLDKHKYTADCQIKSNFLYKVKSCRKMYFLLYIYIQMEMGIPSCHSSPRIWCYGFCPFFLVSTQVIPDSNSFHFNKPIPLIGSLIQISRRNLGWEYNFRRITG